MVDRAHGRNIILIVCCGASSSQCGHSLLAKKQHHHVKLSPVSPSQAQPSTTISNLSLHHHPKLNPAPQELWFQHLVGSQAWWGGWGFVFCPVFVPVVFIFSTFPSHGQNRRPWQPNITISSFFFSFCSFLAFFRTNILVVSTFVRFRVTHKSETLWFCLAFSPSLCPNIWTFCIFFASR